MSYKWFKGAQELKYCSGNVLSIPSASALDNGQYCCTVSNTYGSVLSDVVLVKVVLECTVLPPITQYSESLILYMYTCTCIYTCCTYSTSHGKVSVFFPSRSVPFPFPFRSVAVFFFSVFFPFRFFSFPVFRELQITCLRWRARVALAPGARPAACTCASIRGTGTLRGY